MGYHDTTVADVVREVDTDIGLGLTLEEAARRLSAHGPNRIGGRARTRPFDRLVHQFDDALIWVLIVAAVTSGAVLGEWVEAGVILAIVALNAALGFRQESKADEALSALEALAAPRATVVRSGEAVEVDATAIVTGDVVAVEAGDLVPADLRVIQAVGLAADESTLTGESLPVAKTADPVRAGVSLGERTSMLYAGTVVVAGRGRGVVIATGIATEMGAIAGMLDAENPPTPLEAEMRKVGWRLGMLAVAVAVAIFGLGLAQGRALERIFLLAVALAVAAIPEGLPAVVTLTLARGVKKMAEHNAIVRRLPAVEALGAATVICTDKTGTLTRNEIAVQEVDFASLHLSGFDERDGDHRVARYLQLAVLCNDTQRSQNAWVGDPTEVALVRSAGPFIDVDEMRRRNPREGEIPFDSSRKRMATLHRSGEAWMVAVKGAPESVVPRCARFETADTTPALDSARAGAALEAAKDMAARGLRTLAVAYRTFPTRPEDPEAWESELTLVALVGMRDELRPEAAAAIREAQEAGVDVVMVTGDHEVTARTIGLELGLVDGRQVMSGETLAVTTADELSSTVEEYAVYARVDPAHKVTIVRAWQARGATVAMTGDGVNDAPALRIADIGVAMGSGTDVSRQAADIVLADDNFATIIRAVREGRTIFANLRNVVSFLLAANISEVVVVFFGFLLWGGLGEPLVATQLLWVNLVTDGLPALALGVDPPAAGVMKRPPDRSGVLSWRRQVRLMVTGAILAAPVLAVFGMGVELGFGWSRTQTTGFTALVLTQLAYVYALRVGQNGWAGLSGNRALGWSVAGSLALHGLVVMTPLGNTLFDTVPLGPGEWFLAFSAAGVGGLSSGWLALRSG